MMATNLTFQPSTAADSAGSVGMVWAGSASSIPTTMTSSRRLRQHRFCKESDLVRALVSERDSLFDAMDAFPSHPVIPFLKREWPLGRRIADLLAFSMKVGWEGAVAPDLLSVALLGWTELAVLAHFVRRSMSPDELRECVFMRAGELDALVGSLLRKQVLTSGPGGVLSASDGWLRWLPGTIHLVEAKIEDWSGALEQAEYYRAFADSVSLALPMSFAGKHAVIEACRNSDVGLLLVAPDQAPIIAHRAPQIAYTEAPRKAHLSLQLLKRLVLDYSHAHPVQPTLNTRRACLSM